MRTRSRRRLHHRRHHREALVPAAGGDSGVDKMADGELNVDSLITRLLEGECGAEPRGSSLSSRTRARGRAGGLGGPGSPGARDGGRACGEAGPRPGPLRRGQPSREAAGLRWTAVLASANPSQEGATMPAAAHCVSVECVFLLCSLCALVALGCLRLSFR